MELKRDMELKPERVQHILQNGIGISETLDLSPGKDEVKFAIRDNFSGSLGTITVAIELN